MASKPPSAARINARAAKDRKFLKRALKNPGLRSKLDPKYLSGTQAKARALNTRLNAPITPGSAITERDLAHEAGAATTVRYGPQERELGQTLGIAEQTQRDTGSFYDQYQANLREHAANVQAFQAGAQQAMAQTAQGITGLAGAEGAALQQQANQAAQQQGVTPAGNLLGLASDATAIRQALMGSFQAQQASQGATANTFADTQANVVAPGQKLGALAQAAGRTRDVRKQLTGLKAEEGAFNQQFRAERRADEFKNVLAQQTLGLNTAKAEADIASDAAKAKANTPAAKAAEASTTTQAREEAKNAAKLGLSVHQYRVLGPTERQRRLKALKATKPGSAADNRYSEGPFAGRLKSEVNAMSAGEAQKLVDAYNKDKGKPKGKGKGKGKGPEWKTSEATSRGMSQLTSLKGYADKARRGQPFVAGHTRQSPADRRAAAQKIMASVKAPDDPILITAALDAVYDGHISPATVKKLIAAGYKPSRVAQTLGVPTGRAGRRNQPRQPRRTGPGRNIQIPGVSGPGVSPNR